MSDETREKIRTTQRSKSHREKQSKASTKAWESEERKRKASDNSKLSWSNQEYLDNQRKKQSEKWADHQYRARQADIRKDPEYRKLISESTKKALSDPELLKRLSSMAKKRWESPEYKEKLGKARAEWMRGKVSSLEGAVHTMLDAMGVEYVAQHPIDHFVFDIFVPEKKLLIECQGEYWHGLDRVKRNDASKFRKIDEYFPDHKILYVFERDFLNPEIVKRKLMEALSGESALQRPESFSLHDVVISAMDPRKKTVGSTMSTVETFLQTFHYSSYGRSAKRVFGAFLNGQMIAVCKFSTVHRAEIATSMGLTASSVLDLDRFCIHPRFHKRNFASWFLSRCCKTVFSEFRKVSCLVAFSDFTYGHVGTIYSATNWDRVGAIRPDYHYISEEGIVIHKKTLYNRARKMSMKESDYALLHAYVKAFGKEKIKFVLRRHN